MCPKQAELDELWTPASITRKVSNQNSNATITYNKACDQTKEVLLKCENNLFNKGRLGRRRCPRLADECVGIPVCLLRFPSLKLLISKTGDRNEFKV